MQSIQYISFIIFFFSLSMFISSLFFFLLFLFLRYSWTFFLSLFFSNLISILLLTNMTGLSFSMGLMLSTYLSITLIISFFLSHIFSISAGRPTYIRPIINDRKIKELFIMFIFRLLEH